MKWLAAVLLPMTAVVAGLPGPTPAQADGLNPVGWRPWPAAHCATGAMTAESLPGHVVWVTGWIEPCPETSAPESSRYAIVYFGPSGGVAGRPLHYTDPVERTEFAGQLNTKLPGSRPLAACLAYSPTGLISCISIQPGDTPDRLAVTPIPTDHPQVALPVLPLMRSDGDGGGYCGTCL